MVTPKSLVFHIIRTIKIHNKRTEEIVRQTGQDVFDKSQELVPVDTGALKSTGTYSFNIFEIGDNVSYVATIDYGGESRIGPTKNAPTGIVDYAALVHDIHKPYVTMAWAEVSLEFDKRMKKYTRNLVRNLAKVPQ